MGRPLSLIVALWGAPAAAQEPTVPGVEALVPPAPPPDALPPSLEGEWTWQRVGLVGAGVSDLAVVPASSGVWVAITEAGEVWITLDGGASFTQTLGPTTAEVDPRRRIEGRIREVVDELTAATAGAVSFDPTSTDPSAVDNAQRELALLQDQLDELAQDDEATADAQRLLLPRVWATEDGIFAGRGDGMWRSDDLGGSWRHVLDLPTHGLARVPGRSLWAAGTDDGMRFSVDGSIWLDPEDGTEGLQVADMVAGQDGVWAATIDGVWFAPDAQTWRKVGGSGSILRVRPDPDWVQGAWVATPTGVFRTDDAGASLRAGLGAPLPGVSALLWLGTGRLLSAGADGVWETLDGGTTWAPRSRGLADPDTRALGQDGTQLLLAAQQGVFRLVAGSPLGDTVVERPLIPLGPLIEAATNRQEVIQKTGNRWAATLMPGLDANFDWDQGNALNWSLISGSSSNRGSAWSVSIGLNWTPHSQTSLDDALQGEFQSAWLTDESALSAAFAASESRDASLYRRLLSQQVADLYFARAELDGASPPSASLGETVQTVLRIAEIDAKLDFLTNGAFARLRQDPARENP